MDRRIVVVGWMIVAGACTGAGDAGSAGGRTAAVSEDSLRVMEAQLVEADRRFADRVARQGLGAWVSEFAPGGRMISGGESYIGIEAIRRRMLPAFADSTFSLTWDPVYAEVSASGELGYTVGRYTTSVGAGDEASTEQGTYLTVWRRQDDGSWKVQADIGNPAPPGAARR
ncbi:MAG: nuclear transport factor 2 family protein [Gemmatimonadales bacterium]